MLLSEWQKLRSVPITNTNEDVNSRSCSKNFGKKLAMSRKEQ
jgi:hypothetical protein